MSPTLLLDTLERLGVRLTAERGTLVVDAPRGVLTDSIKAELAEQKPAMLRLLSHRCLSEYAANRLPCIRLTIRETGDVQRDFDLVGRLRKVIEEFQPGGNRVYLTIRTLDGRRVVVEWRAVADRELRLAIAQLLARSARHGSRND